MGFGVAEVPHRRKIFLEGLGFVTGLRVEGCGFRVWGLQLGVQGSSIEFWVEGLGFEFGGLGFKSNGSGLVSRVSLENLPGVECLVWGLGCEVWGVGCGVWGVGCGVWVWGVGCGVWGMWGVGCWAALILCREGKNSGEQQRGLIFVAVLLFLDVK